MYLDSKPRGFTVRLPRHLLRWMRVYGAESDTSEQALAVRIFDWYLRTGQIPPKKEEVRRDEGGDLVVDEHLVGLKFRRPNRAVVLEALEALRRQRRRFGVRTEEDEGAVEDSEREPVRGRLKATSVSSFATVERRLAGFGWDVRPARDPKTMLPRVRQYYQEAGAIAQEKPRKRRG